LLFRTATQGERELRQLGNFSRYLPELLNPSLKGYFEALTERDLHCPNRSGIRTVGYLADSRCGNTCLYSSSWSAVEIDGRAYPHAVANGAYTPFNLVGILPW